MNQTKLNELKMILEEWRFNDYAYFVSGDTIEVDIITKSPLTLKIPQIARLQKYDLKSLEVKGLNDDFLFILKFMYC